MKMIKILSNSDLKQMHKEIREKIDCAIEDNNEESKRIKEIKPEYNKIKAECQIVLIALEEEFYSRGL